MMRLHISVLLVSLLALPIMGGAQTPNTKEVKTVLVTGASAGIGQNAVKRMGAAPKRRYMVTPRPGSGGIHYQEADSTARSIERRSTLQL